MKNSNVTMCNVFLAVGIFTASFCSSIEWIILYYALLTGNYFSSTRF
jgi:hypothetical protein